jgi:hypothetical protein
VLVKEGSVDKRIVEVIMRPIKSRSAIEHARRLLALGHDRIEQRGDELWAEGHERRSEPRGESARDDD